MTIKQTPKQTANQNARWTVGRREWIAMVIGISLYAGITAITSFANLGEAIGGDIRPGIAIPIFFGFVFGPVVGFVVGAFGNFFYDLYAGWVQLPPPVVTGVPITDWIIGLLLNWEIGNGLMGFIPGLYALRCRRYHSWREQLWALWYLVLAVIGGVGFAAFIDLFLYPNATIQMFTTQFFPIVRVNLINAALLVPVLLFNYARLDFTNMRWIRSILLQRFVVTILLSAALPTALLSMFLINQTANVSTQTSALPIQLGLTIALTVLFTLINAVLLAQSILRPLLNLTEAAQAIMGNHFTSQQAAALRENTNDQTEISYLRRVFSEMAEEVITREEKLRQQVNDLKIIIDESKRREQVTEITETDFFRELQCRAAEMRQRRQRQLATAADLEVRGG